MKSKKIPVLLKWIFFIFLLILVPTYWIQYGPGNFLWFSDITLFLAFFAVVFESRLLASMAAVGGIVLESFWAVSFFLTLFFNIPMKLTTYMFNPSIPLWIRLLSLFHLALPPLLIGLILRLGYDRRAWGFQTMVAWIAIILTWFLTDPSKNVNWVYSYRDIATLADKPFIYAVIQSLTAAAIFGITHCFFMLLMKFFKVGKQFATK